MTIDLRWDGDGRGPIPEDAVRFTKSGIVVSSVPDAKGEHMKPTAAPTPEPGYYWVRIASCGWSHETGHSWLLPWTYSWVLVRVEDPATPYVDVFGDDQQLEWQAPYAVVVEIGPRLPEPERGG
jgi:hypothetical protein